MCVIEQLNEISELIREGGRQWRPPVELSSAAGAEISTLGDARFLPTM